MTLKATVASLDGIDEAIQALYVEDKAAGGFRLNVEGLEDTTALKNAKEHEKKARQEVEKKLKELQDAQKEKDAAAAKALEDAARASGDVKAIDESWSKKHTEALAAKDAEYKPLVESLTNDVTRLLIDNVAQGIAADIAVDSDSVPALIPHIKARLGVDIRDNKRTTVVVDENGRPSALTLDEMKKEFVGNKAFARLVAGSKASGSGAAGAKSGGAAGAKKITKAAFDAMSPQDRAAFVTGGGVIAV